MKKKTFLISIILMSAFLCNAQMQLPFTAYEYNPILQHGEPGSWDEGDIIWSYVLNEDNIYYLYYSSSIDVWTQPSSIGLAISTDGYEFNKVEGPIFEPDGSGFDAGSVCFSVVIKDNDEYILYYNGNPNAYSAMGPYIGKATAPTPEGPWDRLDNPILEPGSPGEWDLQGGVPESVITTDSGLLLYYTGGHSINHYRVGLAYFNGITWIKHNDPLTPDHPFAESDPVLKLGNPGDWDDDHAALCNVYKIATGLEMFYTGSTDNTWKIGYATSTDGINWTKHPQNPIYSYEDDPFAVTHGYHVAGNPTRMIKDDQYYMYYDYGLLGPGYFSLAIADIATGYNVGIDPYSGSSLNIFPNPTAGNTTVSFELESDCITEISIYDLIGKKVQTILNKNLQKGKHKIEFDAERLLNGIYFCQLKTDNNIAGTRKMIVLK